MALTPTDSDYEVLEQIGSGSFGIIRKVRRKDTGEIRCRKEISYARMTEKERAQLSAEFGILANLRHIHIVSYFHKAHLKAERMIHIYMEYAGGGDLGGVIKQHQDDRSYMEESRVWTILSQMVQALYRCHYNATPPEEDMKVRTIYDPPRSEYVVLHRDLKPENVFLDLDQNVKLGDFGLSKALSGDTYFANTFVGTPYYMSPEINNDLPYTTKSDIWSLGCVIYELCTLHPPFRANTHLQLSEKIKAGVFEPLPSRYSSVLNEVVSSCLKVDERRRPTTCDLLSHERVRIARLWQDLELERKNLIVRERLMLVRESSLVAREEAIAQQLELKSLDLEAQYNAETARYKEELGRQAQEQFHIEVGKEVQRRLPALVEHEVHMRSQQDAAPHPRTSPPDLSMKMESSSSPPLQSSEGNAIAPVLADERPKRTFDRTVTAPTTLYRDLQQHQAPPGSPMDVHMESPMPMSCSPKKFAKIINTGGRLNFGEKQARGRAPQRFGEFTPRPPLQHTKTAPVNSNTLFGAFQQKKPRATPLTPVRTKSQNGRARSRSRGCGALSSYEDDDSDFEGTDGAHDSADDDTNNRATDAITAVNIISSIPVAATKANQQPGNKIPFIALAAAGATTPQRTKSGRLGGATAFASGSPIRGPRPQNPSTVGGGKLKLLNINGSAKTAATITVVPSLAKSSSDPLSSSASTNGDQASSGSASGNSTVATSVPSSSTGSSQNVQSGIARPVQNSSNQQPQPTMSGHSRARSIVELNAALNGKKSTGQLSTKNVIMVDKENRRDEVAVWDPERDIEMPSPFLVRTRGRR